MTSKHVFRIGDKIRVIRPRWIKRVGYPLIWYELLSEVQSDPQVIEALRALGYCSDKFVLTPDQIPDYFLQAVAKLRVEQRNFGGRERKIIYQDLPRTFLFIDDENNQVGNGEGGIFEIIGKRLAKTGTYFPPSGGYDSWSGEAWFEPGGIEYVQTHIILSTRVGDIEACDVEAV